jgi:hypothetical protein
MVACGEARTAQQHPKLGWHFQGLEMENQRKLASEGEGRGNEGNMEAIGDGFEV